MSDACCAGVRSGYTKALGVPGYCLLSKTHLKTKFDHSVTRHD